MGSGKIYNMHETDDTRRSGAEEAFEEILRKVKATPGGKITKDETVPLYTDIGLQEAEIGQERVVEFELGKLEFQMIRKKEEQRITGSGRQKSLEPMEPPRVTTILKRKEGREDWQVVDLEGML